MNTKNKNNVVPKVYEDLRDYMDKNGYSAVAMLDTPNHTETTQDLYGTNETDVNYQLNIHTR